MKIKKFGKLYISKETGAHVIENFEFQYDNPVEAEACKDKRVEAAFVFLTLSMHFASLANSIKREIPKAPERRSEDFSAAPEGNSKSAEEIVSETLSRIMAKP